MSQATTAKEVLIAARWIIKHIGWCQNAFARNPSGAAIWGSGSYYQGNCFCSIGAIYVVEALPGLRGKAIETLSNLPALEVIPLSDFNDDPVRTKEEVLELFAQAIEQSE